MTTFRAKHLLACTLTIPLVAATTPVIGVAVSPGTIVVNSLTSPGNATIFEGNVLQTGSTPSQVRMKDGAQVRFAADSRGTLFSDHVDLTKGTAILSGFAAKAEGLSVRPDAHGLASVTMHGDVVEVAALAGSVHVFNMQGLNVANLEPGKALSLRAQDAGSSSNSSMTGCPVKQGNDFMLTDETSNVTVKLSGKGIRAARRVQVSGTMEPAQSGSVSVLNVTNVKQIGGTCKPAEGAAAAAAGGAGAAAAGGGGAAAGGAAAAGAGAAAAGVSTATIAAVGVGTAAAAGLGGAAATGAIGGSTSPGK